MLGHMPAFGGFDADALAHFERISKDDFNLLNDLNTLTGHALIT